MDVYTVIKLNWAMFNNDQSVLVFLCSDELWLTFEVMPKHLVENLNCPDFSDGNLSKVKEI